MDTSESSTIIESTDASAERPSQFDAQKWLDYFNENKRTRPMFSLPPDIEMVDEVRVPLIRSLQRFQIGETGDGKHLKKYASRLHNETYAQCVDLFVREEQTHGQVLGEVILSLGGSLLRWHWSDLAFILLRRMLGLKTEILIIQIAEVIGKCFYKCVADKIEDPELKEIFSVIVLDEIAHIHFHSEFMSFQLKKLPWNLQALVHYIWCVIFQTACFVFVVDHRKTLESLGVTPADFIERCSKEFQRSAHIAFG